MTATGHVAWYGEDFNGECGEVVWARNYLEARRLLAEALDLGFEDVAEVRREKRLDNFDSSDDLDEWKWEHGWWFTCGNCNRRCTDGGTYRAEDGSEILNIFVNGEAFCFDGCRETAEYDRQREHEKKEAGKRIAARTGATFGFINVEGAVIGYRDGLCLELATAEQLRAELETA